MCPDSVAKPELSQVKNKPVFLEGFPKICALRRDHSSWRFQWSTQLWQDNAPGDAITYLNTKFGPGPLTSLPFRTDYHFGPDIQWESPQATRNFIFLPINLSYSL